jgi:integrative and conjugative element protein (TIGR02256 family)
VSLVDYLVRLVRDVPVREVAPAERRCIWFPHELIARFLAEAEHYAPHETGGALLGYEVDASFVVRDLVPGGPRARRRWDSFLPDDDWQTAEIARRYELSERVHAYLGEMHSHPHGGTALSRLDRRTTRRIAEHAAARAPHALMVVAAHDAATWTLAAWHYGERALAPARLLVASESVFHDERASS